MSSGFDNVSARPFESSEAAESTERISTKHMAGVPHGIGGRLEDFVAKHPKAKLVGLGALAATLLAGAAIFGPGAPEARHAVGHFVHEAVSDAGSVLHATVISDGGQIIHNGANLNLTGIAEGAGAFALLTYMNNRRLRNQARRAAAAQA